MRLTTGGSNAAAMRMFVGLCLCVCAREHAFIKEAHALRHS
jgi:hypothetical protein